MKAGVGVETGAKKQNRAVRVVDPRQRRTLAETVFQCVIGQQLHCAFPPRCKRDMGVVASQSVGEIAEDFRDGSNPSGRRDLRFKGRHGFPDGGPPLFRYRRMLPERGIREPTGVRRHDDRAIAAHHSLKRADDRNGTAAHPAQSIQTRVHQNNHSGLEAD